MAFRLCAIAASVLLAFSAQAQQQQDTQSQQQPQQQKQAQQDPQKQQEQQINEQHRAALEKCNGMKDNAKDICKAEAKGKEKVAKAELDAQNKPGAKADEKVKLAKADMKKKS